MSKLPRELILTADRRAGRRAHMSLVIHINEAYINENIGALRKSLVKNIE